MNGKGYLLPLFIVLVFIATIALQIYTPATKGYFNLGETAIYTIAALSTPLASGIAAGVGSALADLVTGYWYFAPGTLVIKFVEGYVASYAMRKLRKSPIWFNKALSISTGTIVGALFGGIAWLTLSGTSEVSSFPLSILGIQITLMYSEIWIHPMIWIILAAISIAIVTYLTIRGRRGHAYLATSMVLGGLCMVLGYFLYEYFFSNPVILNLPPEGAFAEIPVNLGQMIAGVVFGVPTANFVLEALGVEDKG
ncbi:protein of unknown function DUF1393 [Ignisphaera aggregans DSM 17230]|uniref:ECF transporter S component n=1 Tax=Ignisphaera aggregans (strain DSM 17230 / JCM 13409 / AQ1.S1) TaxID=583356 RepID=E0SNT2_IGNAA|nr:protein of unknown function DUF1393 [Ignisphaera aggregans DSM 17230]